MDNRLSLDNPRLFLDLLQIRKDRKKDSIIIITGERRSGKSFGAISLAQHLDPTFDLKRQFFFDVRKFLSAWNTMQDGVLILDEASENIDRRRWFAIENHIFNSLITREGYRRNVAILTFPVLADLDIRSQRMSTFHLHMSGINFKEQESFASAYRLKPDMFGSKLRHVGLNQILKFKIPDDKTLEEYGEMKIEWNKEKSEINLNALLNGGKNFSYNVYLQFFRKGLINEIGLMEKLTEAGYNKKDAEMLLLNEKQKMTEQGNKKEVSHEGLWYGEKPANWI